MNEREMQDYLMHYGIKGMRWGHRKDITRLSSERLNKKVNKKLRKGKLKNTDKVAKKMQKKLEMTSEYKRNKQLKEQWNRDIKSPQGASGKLFMDINKSNAAVTKTMKRIAESHLDEYSGALIKDLKYEDTKAGREYVSSILRKNMSKVN